VDNHLVKVLMLAEGRDVILSSGEYEFRQGDFEYNPKAKYEFPKTVTLSAPGALTATLRLARILEAQDMLEAFSPALRFIARHILRIKPGYLRLRSDFELAVTRKSEVVRETGTTLHEIVLFKPVRPEAP